MRFKCFCLSLKCVIAVCVWLVIALLVAFGVLWLLFCLIVIVCLLVLEVCD